MAARAIWKAEVCLASARVPVKLYSAVQDTKVHFRLLHAADRQPVSQVLIDPATDEVVSGERIRKGVEVERGVYVVIGEDERRELVPARSRAILVEQVLDSDSIDPRSYERPYYLGPDQSEDAYFALVEALKRRRRVAVARWVMRNRRYRGALSERKGRLVLSTLRTTDERLELGRQPLAPEHVPDLRELELAEHLIEMLAGPFEPEAYRDEYRARVAELVEAKARGRVVAASRPESPPPKGSLLGELEASVNRWKRGALGR